MKAIRKYDVDRDNALKNLDIKEFIAFMENHEYELGKKFVDDFKKEDKKTQYMTMCKMVCNIQNFRRTETLKKAKKWLKENGISEEIL